jgi:hypothetical protein
VPRFAQEHPDVERYEGEPQSFINDATAILEGFEARLTPGEPLLYVDNRRSSIVAGTIDEEPIKAGSRGRNINLVLPDAQVSRPQFRSERFLPEMSSEDFSHTLLQRGNFSSSLRDQREYLKRDTSLEIAAVGTKKIAGLIRNLGPQAELASLVALSQAGIQAGVKPKIETRRVGKSALVLELSKLAVFGPKDPTRSATDFLYHASDLTAASKVLLVDRDELEGATYAAIEDKRDGLGSYYVKHQAAITGSLQELLDGIFPGADSEQ